MTKLHNPRFERFKSALRDELGDHALLMADSSVFIRANEFSSSREFKTLQRAIDHFARYMPEDLK